MKEHPKLNKAQEYQQKMIEREELNRLYSYNPFGRPGNGAPNNVNKNYINTGEEVIMKNNNNNRTNIDYNLNNKYTQFIPQLKNMMPFNNNPNNDNNNLQHNTNSNYKLSNPNYEPLKDMQYNLNLNNNLKNFSNFRTVPTSGAVKNIQNYNSSINTNQGVIYRNNFQMNNINNNRVGSVNSRYLNSNINENYKGNETSTFPQDSDRKIINTYADNTTNINGYNKANYTEVQHNQSLENESNPSYEIRNQIPPPSNEKDQKHLKVMNYQNELKLQIEEKKRKIEHDKRKEIEMDLQEEEKYKKFMQRKKEQEEDQKNKRRGNKFPSINNEKPNLIHPTKNYNFNQLTDKTNSPKTNSIKEIETHTLKENYTPQYNFQEHVIENDEKELQSFQQMIGLTYDNLKQNIREDANDQLLKLKSEVEKQYNQMTEIFHKLKMDVKEVSDLKYDSERELNKIRDEIEKKKMTNMMYENKLNTVLEKHAPYNNLQIPINEVHPLFLPKNKETMRRHLNLDSTSTMVYNQNEYYNEISSGNNRKNKISNLAQRGQDLIGISEFVPITNNSHSIEKKEIRKNLSNLEDKMTIQEDQNLNNYSKFEYNDMYEKLDRIAELNNKINPVVKYTQLNKDLNDNFKNFKIKEVESNYENFPDSKIDSDFIHKTYISNAKRNYFNDEEVMNYDSSLENKDKLKSEFKNEKIFIKDESGV